MHERSMGEYKLEPEPQAETPEERADREAEEFDEAERVRDFADTALLAAPLHPLRDYAARRVKMAAEDFTSTVRGLHASLDAAHFAPMNMMDLAVEVSSTGSRLVRLQIEHSTALAMLGQINERLAEREAAAQRQRERGNL